MSFSKSSLIVTMVKASFWHRGYRREQKGRSPAFPGLTFYLGCTHGAVATGTRGRERQVGGVGLGGSRPQEEARGLPGEPVPPGRHRAWRPCAARGPRVAGVEEAATGRISQVAESVWDLPLSQPESHRQALSRGVERAGLSRGHPFQAPAAASAHQCSTISSPGGWLGCPSAGLPGARSAGALGC